MVLLDEQGYTKDVLLPDLSVVPVVGNPVPAYAFGPRGSCGASKEQIVFPPSFIHASDGTGSVVAKAVCGSTASSLVGSPERFCMYHLPHRTLVAVASPVDRDASADDPRAELATRRFVEVLAQLHNKITSVKDAGKCLEHALASVQECLLHERSSHGADKNDSTSANGVSLLGGITMKIHGKNPAWMFLCISVGNVKAFHVPYDGSRSRDITAHALRLQADASDSGGQLGVADGVQKGHQLRNKRLYCVGCNQRDVITIMTAGAHNNFHPHFVGKRPTDLGLNGTSWWDNSSQVDEREDAILSFTSDNIKHAMVDKLPSAEVVVDALVSSVFEITRLRRHFIMENADAKEPSQHHTLPGCLGPMTVAAIQIGKRQNMVDDGALDFTIPTDQEQTYRYQVIIPLTAPTPSPDTFSVWDEVTKSFSTLADHIRTLTTTPYLEFVLDIGNPIMCLRSVQESRSATHDGWVVVPELLRTDLSPSGLELWRFGSAFEIEGKALGRNARMRKLSTLLCRLMLSNSIVGTEVGEMLDSLRLFQSNRDTYEVAGTQKLMKMSSVSPMFGILSGDLSIAQRDVTLRRVCSADGERHFRVIRIEGTNAKYMSEFIKVMLGNTVAQHEGQWLRCHDAKWVHDFATDKLPLPGANVPPPPQQQSTPPPTPTTPRTPKGVQQSPATPPLPPGANARQPKSTTPTTPPKTPTTPKTPKGVQQLPVTPPLLDVRAAAEKRTPEPLLSPVDANKPLPPLPPQLQQKAHVSAVAQASPPLPPQQAPH